MEIEVQNVEVANGDPIVVSIPTITVDSTNENIELAVTRKEFNIVGDSVYIGKTLQESPIWLTNYINSLTDLALDDKLSELGALSAAVDSAISSLNVAKNAYENSVITYESLETMVNAKLETLNSSLRDADATAIDLITTKVTAEQASVLSLNAIEASLNDGAIKSAVSRLDSAITTENESRAAAVDSVRSELYDLASDSQATAEATTYLRTRVGIDENNVATGIGLLADIEILQKQNDGVIETYANTYDVMLNAQNQLTAQLVTTAEPYASWKASDVVGMDTRLAHIGDVYVKYSTTATGAKEYISSYKFIRAEIDTTSPYATDVDGFTWALVVDQVAQDAYEQALNAYELADGKITAYFAIEQLTAPGAPGDTITTISGKLIKVPYYWYDTTNLVLKQRVGSSWVTVAMTDANSGDQLQTMKVNTSKPAVDYYIREYNHSSTPRWVERTPNGLVATSEWGVNLNAYLGGNASGGTATLVSDITATTNSDLSKAVNSRFKYNSDLKIDGVTYNSGFGLQTDLSKLPNGSIAGDSEFWVVANKFKVANSGATAGLPVFSIDGSDVVFNGKVSFSSVTNAPKTFTGKLYTTSTETTVGLISGTYVMKYDYSLLRIWTQVSPYAYAFINVVPTIGSTFIANTTIDAVGTNAVLSPNQLFTYNGTVWVKGAMSASEIISSINGNTNTTTIDGGKITTGSIKALQINAGSVTADRLSPTSGNSTVWSGGGLVSSNFNGNVYGNIGTPTQGFRLSSNAAGTSADPNIYGAYIKGGILDGAILTGQLLDISNMKVSNGSANTADFNISLSTYTANSGLRLYGKNYSVGYIPERLVSNMQKIHVQASASYNYQNESTNQSTGVTVRYSLDGGAWIDITSRLVSGYVKTSIVQATAVGSLEIDPTTFNTLDVMFVPYGSGGGMVYAGGHLSVSTTNL